MNEQVIVGAIAAGIAAIALGVAWWRGRVQKATLELQTKQEQRKNPNLAVYYAEGYARNFRTDRFFAFKLRIDNRSDLENTVSSFVLCVGYKLKEGMPLVMELPSVGKPPFSSDGEVLKVPVALKGHGSARGWVYFRLSRETYKEILVDTYELKAIDSDGTAFTINPILLPEKLNAGKAKKSKVSTSRSREGPS